MLTRLHIESDQGRWQLVEGDRVRSSHRDFDFISDLRNVLEMKLDPKVAKGLHERLVPPRERRLPR